MILRRAAIALCLGLPACSGGGEDPVDFTPPARTPEIRPDTPGNVLLHHFAPGEMVETFGSKGGNFLIHFTRQGQNAVPAADADMSGTPDFVEEVADVYEQVLALYHNTLGFRAPPSDQNLPDNGGDGRFDVYLLDFAGMADGNHVDDTCGPQNQEICSGYMVEENDFSGYPYPSTLVANRILGSHEFFHSVQSAYDNGQGSIMAEGTAVWATYTFDPTLKDFEGFLPGFFQNPDRSLNVPLPGPVDPFSYGSAIFFQFLEERYGQGTIRDLWERCENGHDGIANPSWFERLDPMLKARAQTSFADAFVTFATYNLFTSTFADPSRGYKAGKNYPPLKMSEVTAPYTDPKIRSFYASTQYYEMPPDGRAKMTAALVSPDPAQTEGLTVLLAVQRAGAYDPLVKVADVSAGTEAASTDGADGFVIAIVNSLQEGESRRPALCIGSPEEVSACRAGVLGQGGAGGGGGSGGASGSGGGSGMKPPDDQAGCGCREAPLPAPGATWLGIAVFGAIAMRRRGNARHRRDSEMHPSRHRPDTPRQRCGPIGDLFSPPGAP